MNTLFKFRSKLAKAKQVYTRDLSGKLHSWKLSFGDRRALLEDRSVEPFSRVLSLFGKDEVRDWSNEAEVHWNRDTFIGRPLTGRIGRVVGMVAASKVFLEKNRVYKLNYDLKEIYSFDEMILVAINFVNNNWSHEQSPAVFDHDRFMEDKKVNPDIKVNSSHFYWDCFEYIKGSSSSYFSATNRMLRVYGDGKWSFVTNNLFF